MLAVFDSGRRASSRAARPARARRQRARRRVERVPVRRDDREEGARRGAHRPARRSAGSRGRLRDRPGRQDVAAACTVYHLTIVEPLACAVPAEGVTFVTRSSSLTGRFSGSGDTPSPPRNGTMSPRLLRRYVTPTPAASIVDRWIDKTGWMLEREPTRSTSSSARLPSDGRRPRRRDRAARRLGHITHEGGTRHEAAREPVRRRLGRALRASSSTTGRLANALVDQLEVLGVKVDPKTIVVGKVTHSEVVDSPDGRKAVSFDLEIDDEAIRSVAPALLAASDEGATS
jgi:hypothetical protein